MLETNQIATTNLAGAPTPAAEPGAPATAAPLNPPQVLDPQGNPPEIEEEQVVWEARYSMKNFTGRLIVRALLSAGWIALAVYAWGENHPEAVMPAILLGIVLGFLWISLIYRIIRARWGHHYRLTNRRLFATTGMFRRRCDQMELLHVKDVFMRETMLERWLSLGTVVVVSKEAELPTFYLTGVDEPAQVMDLVWKWARAERDRATVQVNRV